MAERNMGYQSGTANSESANNAGPCEDRIVTLEDFREVSKLIAKKWKAVGRYLGISDPELDVLEVNHRYGCVTEVSYQMLREWQMRTGAEATKQKLINALKMAKCVYAWHLEGNANSDTLTSSERLHHHSEFLNEHMEYVFGFNRVILAEGIFNAEERSSLDALEKNSFRLNKQMLKFLKKKDETTYNAFLCALGKTLQSHLKRMIEQNGVYDENEQDRPLTQEQLSYLLHNEINIVENLESQVDELANHLNKGCINKYHYQTITLTSVIALKRASTMMSILRNRSLQHFLEFRNILKELNPLVYGFTDIKNRPYIMTLKSLCELVIASSLDVSKNMSDFIKLFSASSILTTEDLADLTSKTDELRKLMEKLIAKSCSLDKATAAKDPIIKKIIGLKHDESINIYINCPTIQSLNEVHESVENGSMRSSLEKFYNDLLPENKPFHLRVKNVYMIDFKIQEFYQLYDKQTADTFGAIFQHEFLRNGKNEMEKLFKDDKRKYEGIKQKILLKTYFLKASRNLRFNTEQNLKILERLCSVCGDWRKICTSTHFRRLLKTKSFPAENVPDCPSAPIITGITINSCTLTWKIPDGGTSDEPMKFVVQSRVKGAGHWINQVVTSDNSVTISNLSTGSTYEFRIKTMNKDGESPPGPISTPVTFEESIVIEDNSTVMKQYIYKEDLNDNQSDDRHECEFPENKAKKESNISLVGKLFGFITKPVRRVVKAAEAALEGPGLINVLSEMYSDIVSGVSSVTAGVSSVLGSGTAALFILTKQPSGRENLHRHRVFLEDHMEYLYGLNDLILEEEIFTYEEISRLDVLGKDSVQINSEIIQFLSKKDIATYEKFLEALEKSFQSHLKRVIVQDNKFNENELDRPLTEPQLRLLSSNQRNIVDHLSSQVDYIALELLSKSCISQYHYEQITPAISHARDRTRTLISIMRNRSLHHFLLFRQILNDQNRIVYRLTDIKDSSCYQSSSNAALNSKPIVALPIISNVSNTSVLLTWTLSNDSCSTEKFIIQYRTLGSDIWINNLETVEHSAEIQNLKEGSMYEFRVIVFNKHGESLPGPATRPVCIPNRNLLGIRERLLCHREILEERMEYLYGLNDVMLELEILTSKERSVLDACGNDAIQINRKILEFIYQKDEEANQKFLHALGETSQSHLRKLILQDGVFTDDEQDRPLTKSQLRYLQCNKAEIIEYLIVDIDDITNELYQDGCINIDHFQKINEIKSLTRLDTARVMMSIMTNRSIQHFLLFRQILSSRSSVVYQLTAINLPNAMLRLQVKEDIAKEKEDIPRFHSAKSFDKGLPSSPTEPIVSSVTSNSLVLSWNWSNDYDTTEHTNFLVQYRLVDSEMWKKKCETSELSAKIEYLREGSTYEFRVIAFNERGESLPGPRTRPVCITDTNLLENVFKDERLQKVKERIIVKAVMLSAFKGHHLHFVCSDWWNIIIAARKQCKDLRYQLNVQEFRDRIRGNKKILKQNIEYRYGLAESLYSKMRSRAEEIKQLEAKGMHLTDIEFNEILLNWICESEDINLYRGFMKSLTESSQSHLAAVIIKNGKFSPSDLNRPLTEVQRDCLRSRRSHLVPIFIYEYGVIVDRLIDRGCINGYQQAHIEDQLTRVGKARALIDIICKLNVWQFRQFRLVLQEINSVAYALTDTGVETISY